MRKTVFLTGLLIASFLLFASRPTAKAEEINQPQTNVPQQIIVDVQKGDSLSKIANKHQTTYKRLYDANTFIQDPNIIHPGDKVRVPDAGEQIQTRVEPAKAQLQKTVPKQEKPIDKPIKKTTVKKTKTVTENKTTNVNTTILSDGGVWDDLAKCESGGNWAINTGNGFYGGLQFTASTWKAVGGSGLPHQASREEQIMRGQILQSRSGWGQWPACTKKLGLR